MATASLSPKRAIASIAQFRPVSARPAGDDIRLIGASGRNYSARAYSLWHLRDVPAGIAIALEKRETGAGSEYVACDVFPVSELNSDAMLAELRHRVFEAGGNSVAFVSRPSVSTGVYAPGAETGLIDLRLGLIGSLV